MNTEKQERIRYILNRKFLPLFAFLHIPVPQGLEETVIKKSDLVTAVKDQFIAESGEEGRLIYFESGIARCYYYDTVTGKYVTTRITRKDEVLIDINSYLYGSKQSQNVQMLEAGTLITLNYANLKLLLSAYQSIYPIFLYILAEREKYQLSYQHLLMLNVQERVSVFLATHPGMASRVNNDHIAGYLNMSRSTFSSAYAKYRAENEK